MSDHRSSSGRYIDWPRVIDKAADAEGRWVIGFRNAPATIARDIREQRRAVLREDATHRLEARTQNEYTHPDTGTERADIYVRWVPVAPKEPRVPKDRHDLKITDVTAAQLDALARMAGLEPRGARSRMADEILREYGEGAARRSEVVPYTPVPIAIYTSPGVWQQAEQRSSIEGISITAALAEFTQRRLDREQQIRSEGAGLE